MNKLLISERQWEENNKNKNCKGKEIVKIKIQRKLEVELRGIKYIRVLDRKKWI